MLEKFITIFKEIVDRNDFDEPDYYKIINILKTIKDDICQASSNNIFKFKWIRVFKEVCDDNNSDNNKYKKQNIKNLFRKYCLKLDKYLEYIHK